MRGTQVFIRTRPFCLLTGTWGDNHWYKWLMEVKRGCGIRSGIIRSTGRVGFWRNWDTPRQYQLIYTHHAVPLQCRFASDFSRPRHSTSWYVWIHICRLSTACGLSHQLRFLPTTTRTFTKDTTTSVNGRGTARHVWISLVSEYDLRVEIWTRVLLNTNLGDISIKSSP